MMTRLLPVLAGFLVMVMLAVGCGGQAPTPEVYPTVVFPPTFTPVVIVEPSPTPTVTGIPPTPTPDAETQKVIAGLVRTARLPVYRAQMRITVKDSKGSFPGATPNQEFPLMTMEGRVSQ